MKLYYLNFLKLIFFFTYLVVISQYFQRTASFENSQPPRSPFQGDDLRLVARRLRGRSGTLNELWCQFREAPARVLQKDFRKYPRTSNPCTSAPFAVRTDSKKEVFQPHLPVRLPCYDLAPVTTFALGRSFRSRTSGARGFHGLTGGVYKARERIHRAMADARLLANPTSWSRVADSSPN